jgi:mannosyltransferase OCH1-like enzyme
MKIPKIIHQTHYSDNPDSPIRKVVSDLRDMNPDWDYRFYNDYECFKFVRDNYNERILKAYNSINPIYGAAKADFFRYLLMFKFGGVYLDIKSTATEPLNHIIGNSEYILAHWDNTPTGTHPGSGLLFADFPWGEFQQWHIICAPAHPFLLAVISKVLFNIEAYDVKIHGVGWYATLNMTGPIAYTQAIVPILNFHNYLRVRKNADAFLVYNFKDLDRYKNLPELNRARPHYSEVVDPIILK